MTGQQLVYSAEDEFIVSLPLHFHCLLTFCRRLVSICISLIFPRLLNTTMSWNGVDHNDVFEYMINSGMHDSILNYMKGELFRAEWNRDIEKLCKQTIKEVGIDQINYDQLLNQVMSPAKKLVPEQVQQNVFNMIRVAIEDKLATSSDIQ